MLHEAYLTKKYPFNLTEAEAPQIKDNLPKSLTWSSREHACFLFKLCYWMRGGINSHTATKALTQLYNQHPSVFLPENWNLIEVNVLQENLQKVGLGFNCKNISTAWIENSKKINTEWNNDPRTLFIGISSYEEACQRIQNIRKKGFKGFQEKMVSMLTYFYMDAGIVDQWNFPIPVDFHVLRTIFANEIIIPKTSITKTNGLYTKEVLSAIRKLFMWYCIEYSISPITLCEAVWLHSRLMCANHPGNISKIGKRNGRKTILSHTNTWNESQTRMFEKTCLVCKIQDTCKWCVPSAEYYIGGRLILRKRRDTPYQEYLFSIENLASQ